MIKIENLETKEIRGLEQGFNQLIDHKTERFMIESELFVRDYYDSTGHHFFKLSLKSNKE